MKYRDLKIKFSMEDIDFTVLSICLEKLIKPIPMHTHSKNSYELHYISYGYGTLITGDTQYKIAPGTLFMTGPEIEHEQISAPDNPMTEYCIYFKINGIDKKKYNPSQNLIHYFLSHTFWIGVDSNNIHEIMKNIIRELENKYIGYEFVIQSLLQQAILQMIRYYKANDTTKADSMLPTQNVNDLTYLIIEEAFLYDYNNITLDSLALQVGLGKRQTERLLQMHYNKTFLQKKTEARMSAASTLLRDKERTISSIAYDLGYSSVEHFSNAFKRYFHKTPTVYRKEI